MNWLSGAAGLFTDILQREKCFFFSDWKLETLYQNLFEVKELVRQISVFRDGFPLVCKLSLIRRLIILQKGTKPVMELSITAVKSNRKDIELK